MNFDKCSDKSQRGTLLFSVYKRDLEFFFFFFLTLEKHPGVQLSFVLLEGIPFVNFWKVQKSFKILSTFIYVRMFLFPPTWHVLIWCAEFVRTAEPTD